MHRSASYPQISQITSQLAVRGEALAVRIAWGRGLFTFALLSFSVSYLSTSTSAVMHDEIQCARIAWRLQDLSCWTLFDHLPTFHVQQIVA